MGASAPTGLTAAGVGSLPMFGPPRVWILATGDELVPPGRPLGPGRIYETNSVTLRALVARAAVEELFWRVRVKPGKPLFCGLTGNGLGVRPPLSGVVGFLVFVKPLLRGLAGERDPADARVRVRTIREIAPEDGRTALPHRHARPGRRRHSRRHPHRAAGLGHDARAGPRRRLHRRPPRGALCAGRRPRGRTTALTRVSTLALLARQPPCVEPGQDGYGSLDRRCVGCQTGVMSARSGRGPRPLRGPAGNLVRELRMGRLRTTIPAAAVAVAFMWPAGAGADSLEPVATAVSTGANPQSVAFSSGGNLAATADASDGTVSLFSVEPGASGLASTGTFNAGATPLSVAFSPTAMQLASANFGESALQVFEVADGGTLIAKGAPAATGSNPTSVAYSRGGANVASADKLDNGVTVFRVEADATLTRLGSLMVASPVAVAFSPRDDLLAVASDADNAVTVFRVSGTPAVVAQTPTGDSDGAPTALAFSPQGDRLAVANGSGGSVSMFAVTPSGTLTAVPGSPLDLGRSAASVSISRGGGLLAVAHPDDGSVSVASLAANGAPTLRSDSPLEIGQQPTALAFSPEDNLLLVADSARNTLTAWAAVPPTVQIDAPVADAVYLKGADVPVAFSCVAGAVELASCAAADKNSAVLAGAPLDTSRPGVHALTAVATDRDGNTTSETVAYGVTPPPTQAVKLPRKASVNKKATAMTLPFATARLSQGRVTRQEETGADAPVTTVNSGSVLSGNVLQLIVPINVSVNVCDIDAVNLVLTDALEESSCSNRSGDGQSDESGEAQSARRGRGRMVRIARVKARVTLGQTNRVRIRFNRTGRRLFRSQRRVRLVARAKLTDANGVLRVRKKRIVARR